MMLMRTAKSCRSDAPMLASSLREGAQATVSNKPGHRGDHELSRQTIARAHRELAPMGCPGGGARRRLGGVGRCGGGVHEMIWGGARAVGSGVKNAAPGRGHADRSPVLTIFWHCGCTHFSSRTGLGA